MIRALCSFECSKQYIIVILEVQCVVLQILGLVSLLSGGGGKFTVSMNIARELVATQEQNIFELSLYLICVTAILSFFLFSRVGRG